MKWAPVALLAASRAAHALLDGGTLRLYAGEAPVGELGFQHPALRGDHLGPLVPDEACEGQGRLTSAVAFSKDGTPVAELTVGLVGSGSDIEMKGLDVQRGSRLEIETLRAHLPTES